MYLLAVVVILAAWARRSQCTVGCMVPNRVRPQDQDTVGFFANIIPIAVSIDWSDRCAAYLASAHRTIFQSLKRQDVPYGLLLSEWSGDPYRFDATPFEALFTYRPRMRSDLVLEGCTVTYEEPPCWPLPFELMIDFDQRADACHGLLRWDDAVFGGTLATVLREGFSDVVRRLYTDSDAPLASIRELVDSMSTPCTPSRP
jgi:hypothetical protein